MPKTRRRKRTPKRVLALPDLEQSKAAVLNSLTSKSGQRSYDHAVTDSVEWHGAEPRLAFNRSVVLRCPPGSRVYNKPLAEKAWSRLLALYGKALA